MGDTCVMTTPVRQFSGELALENAHSLRRLLVQVRVAAARKGMDAADLASCMHLDVDTVEAALSGRLDLTMSDLQELAVASGALITFVVQSGADKLLDTRVTDAIRTKSWEPPCPCG